MVSEREEGVVAITLPIGSLKTSGWSRIRDANPVPTSPLADDPVHSVPPSDEYVHLIVLQLWRWNRS